MTQSSAIAHLYAKIECLHNVTKRFIGQPMYFRNSLDDPWKGPKNLKNVIIGVGVLCPFEDEFNTSWEFCRYAHPILNQVWLVPMEKWEPAERPFKDSECILLVRTRDRKILVGNTSMFPITWWDHTDPVEDNHIIEVSIIRPEISEEG